jgi:hypothetical protein
MQSRTFMSAQHGLACRWACLGALAVACSTPRGDLASGDAAAARPGSGGANSVGSAGGSAAGGTGGTPGRPGTGGSPSMNPANPPNASDAGGPEASGGPTSAKQLWLHVAVAGGGRGRVSGSGGHTFECTDVCKYQLPEGTSITVSARPEGPSVLTGWIGGCAGQTEDCTVRLQGETYLTANFELRGSPIWETPIRSHCAVYGVEPVGTTAFVAGMFNGTIDFGGPSLTSAGMDDAFLIGLSDEGGSVRWQKSFGGVGHEAFYGLVPAAAGGVVAGGSFGETTVFGPGVVVPKSPAGAALVRFESMGTDGVAVQAVPAPLALALARSGPRTVVFGGGIQQHEPSGAAVPGTFISAPDSVNAAVVMPGGDYLVGGGVNNRPLTLAGKTYNPPAEAPWVARLQPTGQVRWGHVFVQGQDAKWISSNGVAVDSNGDVYVAGTFKDRVDIAGVVTPGQGEDDVFLLKLSGATGNVIWKKMLGTAGDDYLPTVEADGDTILFGARLGAVADLGGGPLAAPGAILARFRLDGSHVWSVSVPFIPYTITATDKAIYIGGNGVAKLRP